MEESRMEHRPAVTPLQSVPNSAESTSPLSQNPRSCRDEDRAPNKSWERDGLTGLHGQRYLCHAIDQCLKKNRRPGLTATLALLQLENFYEIRNWVGISEADLLLADMAQLLKKLLPKRVLLCRCHNYEFAALLLEDSSINARLITDKLKQALLSAVSPVLPRQIELKCGVGLAKLDSNIASWPVVFARARHNLRLAHHHRELPAELSSVGPDIELEQLRATLNCSELELNYQPWAHFKEQQEQHYEVRCSLSALKPGLPTILLFETAARNALGEQIDRRIIEQVLARLGKNTNTQLRLVINLSHNSVVSIQFLRWLEKRLSESQRLASQLVFQISETDALIAQHHLITFCEVILKSGCKISLSNFGCTPNPLRYLSLVPASYVKLDCSMLNKVDANLDRLQSLTMLVADLHERQIAVVAPGLEQLKILPPLWQARVDYLQGYCVQRPVAVMEYRFLKTRTLSFA